jgi:anhydro-N-acetylmuramic acid kinase
LILQKNKYSVVGVMSGTSLDGVDLILIDFDFNNEKWTFETQYETTVAYSVMWEQRLKNALSLPTHEIEILNEAYTALLAEIINDYLSENKIQHLDAVCSHGHTVLHQPEIGLTLQIGNLPQLASLIQQTVVCNFRVQDVQLGGQGAPLVPIGDQILFSEYNYCLNLGGFSNISFENNDARTAFDICAVNTVLNFYANQLGLNYDNQGYIARQGQLCEPLFNELNQLDFYKQNHPKSLGMEFVNEILLPIIDGYSIPIPNILHTFVMHIAFQIAAILPKRELNILVTGGGAYNLFLIEKMKYYLPNATIIVPQASLVEFKEAIIFGLLGVLKLRNEVNVLSSVTGAINDHCSGYIYQPNYEL